MALILEHPLFGEVVDVSTARAVEQGKHDKHWPENEQRGEGKATDDQDADSTQQQDQTGDGQDIGRGRQRRNHNGCCDGHRAHPWDHRCGLRV